MWMVGSYPDFEGGEAVTVSTTGTVAAGDYYLWDSTASLSLASQVITALTSAGATTPALFFTPSGRLRLTFGAVTSVTWDDTVLRDVLGFAGNLSGAAAYTATSLSPLFWSPGRTESPRMGVLGSQGAKAYDSEFSEGPGWAISTTQNEWYEQRFTWSYIPTERFATKDEANGEFVKFFHEVLVRARLFKAYRSIAEDRTDTTSQATVPVDEVLGPYVWKPRARGGIAFPFARESAGGLDRVDAMHPISIDCRTVPGFVP